MCDNRLQNADGLCNNRLATLFHCNAFGAIMTADYTWLDRLKQRTTYQNGSAKILKLPTRTKNPYQLGGYWIIKACPVLQFTRHPPTDWLKGWVYFLIFHASRQKPRHCKIRFQTVTKRLKMDNTFQEFAFNHLDWVRITTLSRHTRDRHPQQLSYRDIGGAAMRKGCGNPGRLHFSGFKLWLPGWPLPLLPVTSRFHYNVTVFKIHQLN